MFKQVIGGDGLGQQRRGSSVKNNMFWEVALDPFFVFTNMGYFVITKIVNILLIFLYKAINVSLCNFF